MRAFRWTEHEYIRLKYFRIKYFFKSKLIRYYAGTGMWNGNFLKTFFFIAKIMFYACLTVYSISIVTNAYTQTQRTYKRNLNVYIAVLKFQSNILQMYEYKYKPFQWKWTMNKLLDMNELIYEYTKRNDSNSFIKFYRSVDYAICGCKKYEKYVNILTKIQVESKPT